MAYRILYIVGPYDVADDGYGNEADINNQTSNLRPTTVADRRTPPQSIDNVYDYPNNYMYPVSHSALHIREPDRNPGHSGHVQQMAGIERRGGVGGDVDHKKSQCPQPKYVVLVIMIILLIIGGLVAGILFGIKQDDTGMYRYEIIINIKRHFLNFLVLELVPS